MHQHYDSIILGGGAAGLFCALTAGQRGRNVLVLERSNKVGKKILMSGGGRCNFTNLHISPERFLSHNPHFFKSALAGYSQWDFIGLVERHGIEYFEKQTVNGLSGQLYCHGSSKQIVRLLLDECEKATDFGGHVEIRTQCETESVGPKVSAADSDAHQHSYTVKTDQGNFSARTLVVATGGLSIPAMGGSGFGYRLAEQFGLDVFPRTAGLVPFTVTDQFSDTCKRLSGVSTEVSIGNERAQFREDLLFTHRGLSGPAVLQLSSYWQPGEPISCNLFPGINLAEWLIAAKSNHPKMLLRNWLSQKLSDCEPDNRQREAGSNLDSGKGISTAPKPFRERVNNVLSGRDGLPRDHFDDDPAESDNASLPKALCAELESILWPQRANTPLAEWPDQALTDIADTLNNWVLRPAGTEGYRTAEVTLGGVNTDHLNQKTMECKDHPGLYFIGEVVDVTGHLGGFNFQWAWASGYAAGRSV